MRLLTGRTNRCFPGASVLEETDIRQDNSHLTEAVPEVGAKTEKKRELGARAVVRPEVQEAPLTKGLLSQELEEEQELTGVRSAQRGGEGWRRPEGLRGIAEGTVDTVIPGWGVGKRFISSRS